MNISDLLFGTDLAALLGGQQSNPAYQQAQIQLGNLPRINDAAWNAYNQYLGGGTPQQQIAGFDPMRQQGIQNQIAAAGGLGQQLAQGAAGTAGTLQSGAGAGQGALQNIAGGMGPQFGGGVAQDYMNFLQPNLMGAQEALANQANLAWNQNVGNIGALGGGFASSGRNNALGQAAQNAATQLGAQQQQLAYNAALQAAQAGQQAGLTGYQGQLTAGQALGNQALQGAGLTQGLQSALLQPGQVQEAGGVAQQQQRQNELNAQFQNQLLQQQDPFKAINYLSSALGTLGPGTQAANLPTPTNLSTVLDLLGKDTNQVLGGIAGGIGNVVGSIWDSIFGPSTSAGTGATISPGLVGDFGYATDYGYV